MPGGVIVFGSINIDLVCRAERIPLPGETVLAPSYDFFAGGKGANQAVAAARAGAAVSIVGAVGRDAFAEIPRRALADSGVQIGSLHQVEAPTGAAFITVSKDGENAITVASGANRLIRASMINSAAWQAYHYLLLQGELDWSETRLAAETAQRNGVKVILNAAPAQGFDIGIMSFIDVLIVNSHEMAEIAARFGIVDANLRKFSEKIGLRQGGAVIVTRGAQGVECSGSEDFLVPAHPVSVIDTTGAGDTFCGVFAAMLAQGRTLKEAAKLATVAGGLACTAHGAQSAMPFLTDIEAAVRG